jgi:exosortase C (VPDSG-CTERM-specific)
MQTRREQTTAGTASGRRRGGSARWRSLPRARRLRIGGWAGYVVLLTLLFARPLASLMLYAAGSNLHSHILLVPLVAGYLLYNQQRTFATEYRSSIFGTITVGGIGLAALAAGLAWRGRVSVNDELALMALAFVSFVAAGGFLLLGSRWMAAAAFPVAFLIFMVPLPDAAVDWLERASVLASAEVAAWYFSMAGTSLVRHGTVFELPGIVLQVGQECSGIRSSWVLVITSLLASHLFLRSPWRRLVVVAFVIPLGILRNGFRILVIGLLCVLVGPHMIDSPIHHRGGPMFFALSLIPLFLLLWWLRHQEQAAAGADRLRSSSFGGPP